MAREARSRTFQANYPMPRILLVDDNLVEEQGVCAIISGMGLDVIVDSANSITEFWYWYAHETYAAIVLDMMLPVRPTFGQIDAYAGVKIICTLKDRGNLTPVILHTGRWSSDPACGCLQNIKFICTTVFKPTDEHVLCRALKSVLPRRKYAGKTK